MQVGTGGVPRAGYETDRNNFAPRLGFAWSATPETVVRGSYGIYYNLSALAPSEGLYFSDPYFHLDFFFPAQGLPPLTLYDPFPANYPIPVAPVGLHVPARPEDAVPAALQRRRAASAWRHAQRRGHLRRLARLVARDGPRSQPAAPEHDVAEPAAESLLRRHHDPRVGGPIRIQQPAAEVRAAQREGRLGAGRLHAGQVRGRRLGVLPERRRPELPAGQPEHGGRVRAVEFRRAAPPLGGPRVGHSLGRRAGRGSRSAAVGLAGQRRGDAAERPALHRRAAAGDRQQQHRPRQPWLRLQRPAQRRRRSWPVRPHCREVVRHGRVRVPGVRDLRQLGPQYGGRPRLPERQPGVDEAPAARRALEAAVEAGSLQPVQPHELQSAGQLPGVADLRADPVGAEPAKISAGREGAFRSCS